MQKAKKRLISIYHEDKTKFCLFFVRANTAQKLKLNSSVIPLIAMEINNFKYSFFLTGLSLTVI